MGGDHAPAAVVEGALEALHESRGRFTLALVGQADRISAELSALEPRFRHRPVPPGSTTIVHAPEVIDMKDTPTAALKSKRQSSIAGGLAMHREGKAHAFISAGNTGAVLSGATLILGRIPGVGRPTIGAMIPTAKDPCMMLDAGANVDCRPQHLKEFAIMGSIYVSAMLGKPRPRVGLLSIGEEDSKGNEASLEALKLLRKTDLNFAGNVEGRDLLTGEVDVVVCDGFVGNILLKFGESIPRFFKAKFRALAQGSPWTSLVGLLARNGLRRVMRELDYQEHGGVPLLGVNGVVIIGHGGSTPKAIKNMIYRAEEMITHQVNRHIQEMVTRSNE